MTKKTTVLLALLTPGLALLGACASEGTTADTTAPTTSSSTAADTSMHERHITDQHVDRHQRHASGMGATTSGSSTTSTGTMGSDGHRAAARRSAELDKNHDGSLTRDELPSSSSIASQFSTYDTNGDGKLSETKYNAASGNPSSPQ